MTQLQTRLIIALDEWLGVLVLVTLRHERDWLFYAFFAGWFIAVYLIAYPDYFRRYNEWPIGLSGLRRRKPMKTDTETMAKNCSDLIHVLFEPGTAELAISHDNESESLKAEWIAYVAGTDDEEPGTLMALDGLEATGASIQSALEGLRDLLLTEVKERKDEMTGVIDAILVEGDDVVPASGE